MRRFPYFWLLISPFALYALGVFLNVIVISANHGMMPVAMQTAYGEALQRAGALDSSGILDASHKVMQAKDHLKILADWIQIPHDGTYSIGDELMMLGDNIQKYFLGAWLALVARDHKTKARHATYW